MMLILCETLRSLSYRLKVLFLVSGLCSVCKCGILEDSSKSHVFSIEWLKNFTNAKLSCDGMYSSGNVNRFLINNRLLFNIHFKIFELTTNSAYVFGKQNFVNTEDDFLNSITGSLWHKSPTYLWGMLSNEKIFSRGIIRRQNFGIGIGFNLIRKTKEKQLTITYGYLYEYTSFVSLDEIETLRMSLRVKGKHELLNRKLRLFHESYLQPSIVNAENIRFRSVMTIEVPLNKFINFKTSYNYLYENVVSNFKKRFDQNITWGLAISY